MIKSNIPIIFIHTGIQFYLKNAIHHATYYNNDNQIFLIGDKSNKKLDKKYKLLKHFFIDDYLKKANEFKKKYIHLSSNKYDYELFCFQRWFIIEEFMTRNNIETALCLDTDVLLYCNVNKEFSKYLKYDFTICRHNLPCATLMKIDTIKKFTNFITTLYTNNNYLLQLKQINQNSFNNKGQRISLVGVSDMTAFDFYQKKVSDNVFDLIYPHDGVCFDGKFNIADGFSEKKGVKEIIWKDNLPYGKYKEEQKLIRFLGLHFQGRSKMRQHHYLINKKGIHTSPTLKTHWIMMIAWMKKYYSALKKIKYTIKFFKDRHQVKKNV